MKPSTAEADLVGVFVEPVGAFRASVVDWKRRVIDEIGGDVTYVSHPPHVSVFVFEPKASWNEISDLFAQGVRELESCTLCSRGTVRFSADPLSGGETIAYTFDSLSVARLQEVQMRIVNVLSGLAVVPPQNHYLNFQESRNEFSSSLRKYGYPFVGEIWIPHCTIASIPTSNKGDLVRDFLAQEVEFHFELNVLSLWKIQGDHHEEIMSAKLQ